MARCAASKRTRTLTPTNHFRGLATSADSQRLLVLTYFVGYSKLVADQICDGEAVEKTESCSGIRKRDVVRCRKIFCQIAVKEMGHSGAKVARFPGITTSGVNCLAVSDLLSDIGKYH